MVIRDPKHLTIYRNNGCIAAQKYLLINPVLCNFCFGHKHGTNIPVDSTGDGIPSSSESDDSSESSDGESEEDANEIFYQI